MKSDDQLYIVSMLANLCTIRSFCDDHKITYQYKDNFMLLMTNLPQETLEASRLFSIKMAVKKDLFLSLPSLIVDEFSPR